MTTETKVIKMQFVEEGANQVTNGVKKMSGAAKTADSSFTSFSRTLLRFASIGAVTLALRKATSAALDFGTAMAEVRTLLDDQKQFEQLEQNVRAISLQFGQAPAQQAKALYQVISAGAQGAAEATDILTVSNKLAIAGVTDVAVAADALTTVLNAYQGAAGSAIDVSDKFFVAVKAGKTTVDELASSIGSVSGVAAQVGVSLDEVLAATAALTKGTLNTARSIRGLRAVMTAVIKPTQEAKDLAGALELQFDAAALKSKGFATFLKEVSDATKNNSALLAQLFGNVEGLVPIMALAGTASEDFAAILDQMGDSAGKTDEAFDIMSATMEFKLNRFMTALNIIAINVGNVLLTVLAPAASLAAENIDILATAIIGLTAALVAVNFGTIVTGVKALAIAVKGLFVLIASSPIGLLIAGLTALGVGAVALNRKLMVFQPTWELIKNSFFIMINAIQQGFNTFANWIEQFFFKIGSLLSELRIKAQEAFIAIAEIIPGTGIAESAKNTYLDLIAQQQVLNAIVNDNIQSRELANRELAKENELLIANLKVAKDQLFTEREKQEVQSGAGAPNAPAAPGTPELNDELAEQQRLQVKLLELQERGLQLTKDLRTPTEIYTDQMKELNELLDSNAISLDTYNRAMTKYQEEMQESSNKTEEFGDLFDKAINGTLTAKDLFLVAVRQILTGLFDMNKQAQDTTDSFLQLGNSLGGGGGFGSSLGSIVGSIFGSFFSPAPVGIPAPPPSINAGGFGLLAANGAVMHRGTQKFANGGVFDSPLSFPMSGGRTGMMAEAGPEAIMPLERTSGGKLGVNASGMAPKVDIQIIDQRSGGEQAEVQQNIDAQGNRQIRVMIRDEVNKGFAAGSFDKSLKTFGVSRGGNRR